MDRCTVVLPRPGDGWYAPPSSGASAGGKGKNGGENSGNGCTSLYFIQWEATVGLPRDWLPVTKSSFSLLP